MEEREATKAYPQMAEELCLGNNDNPGQGSGVEEDGCGRGDENAPRFGGAGCCIVPQNGRRSSCDAV